MTDDTFNVDELRIKELPEPPAFGFWLSFLAIGLALTAIRPIALLADAASLHSIGFLLQLAISVWSLVNLFLLIKRRRAFINSMIALLVVNAIVLPLVFTVSFATTTISGQALLLPLVSLVVGALWVVYLARSKHVREVCVR